MPDGEVVHVGPESAYWTPLTSEERDAVRSQLDRILHTPQFRISRRYPKLLSHVVERRLQARAEELKERTLGVEVFGRDPAYDTNTDPVVRMTAVQVRRRLAEYYQESGREREIRIELPVGSYVPVFRKPAEPEPRAVSSANPAVPTIEESPLPVPVRRVHFLVYTIAAVMLLGLGAGYFTLVATARETALEKFWGPVWVSSNSVLICVGGGLPPAAAQSDAQKPPSIQEVIRQHRLAWADALTFSNLAAFIRVNGKTPIPRRAGETSFAQMREGPAVLIGGYNNQWILRLTDQLRFSYESDPAASLYYIQDRQNPSQRQWVVDVSAPHATFGEDYGIVMRYLEPATQQFVVVASGIAYYGTLAAGEFLTDRKSMEMLAARAPQDWRRKNLEVVFSTRIINGETGPPGIVATHFW